MVSRKYTSDYRLEDTIDARSGKLVSRAVYQGQWFRFCLPEDVVKRTARIYAALTALCAALLALPLLFDAGCMRAAYVALPFVALVLPLFYLAAGCWRLMTAKGRVTREHRDKTVERLRGASIAMCALSGVSMVGLIVYWCLQGFGRADAACLISALALLAVNLTMLLRLHKNVAMEPVTEPAPQEKT